MTADEEPSAIAVAIEVAVAIESVGGSYFVGGSVASSLQGEPRATNDIDIVLSLPLGRIQAFVDALGPRFQVDVDMLRDALLHARSCNVFFLPRIMKVDLFAVGPDAYDEVEFARRRRVPVNDRGDTLVLKTPEDTVLRKMLWYRAGGETSEKQWRDIVEVLRVSAAELDSGYLDSWARRLNLGPLLSKARSDAEAD